MPLCRLFQTYEPVQTTPLFDCLKNKGAVFGQIAGWERAFWFDLYGCNKPDQLSFCHDEPWHDAVRRECESVRDAVGVMDHGGFTKFEVQGPGASEFINRVFCGRLPDIGRIKLSYILTPLGKIWSEATIARLDENRFLLCGPTIADQRDHDWLRSRSPSDNSVELQRGSKYDAALMVMGPKSRELLSQICDADLGKTAMPWMSVAELSVAGCAVIAIRVSYVGELGWELHMKSEHLIDVYNAVSKAGAQFKLVNFGSYALNSMRLEKAYHAWGADFGIEYTMFDAGLDKFIDFDKSDFIGRDEVLKQQKQEPEWRFVRLIVESTDAVPLPGDPILLDDECVGYVTSGGSGFRIGKCLALGYVNNTTDPPAEEYTLQILGKLCRAELATSAFYDSANQRLLS